MINSFLLMLSIVTMLLTLRTMHRTRINNNECHASVHFIMWVIAIMCLIYALLSAQWIYDGDYKKIGCLKDISWNLFEMLGMMAALRFLSLVESCPLRRVGEILIEDGKIDEETLAKALAIQERERASIN